MIIPQIDYRHNEAPEQWATHYRDERARLCVPKTKSERIDDEVHPR